MKNLLFTLLLLQFTPLGAIDNEAEPFWRRKAHLFRSLVERRKIVVSSEIDSKNQRKNVRIQGAGVVHVPKYFALEQVMNFERLPEVSSFFKKVVHKPKTKQVYFHIQALGMEVRFLQQYRWQKNKQDVSQLDWKVVWGTLQGMEGHYQFRKLTTRKTEVAIWASQKNIKWPIPDFMVNFTLEVIAEKTAQKMRTFMEESYRQQNQPGKSHAK